MTIRYDQQFIPPVIRNAPSCPCCYADTEWDGDGWECKPCGLHWESGGQDGWRYPEDEQCSAEVQPYPDHKEEFMRAMRYRCVRNAGHSIDGPFERHVGTRGDGGIDYSGYPHEWRDDDPEGDR